MTTGAFILMILLQGWGNGGAGSAGNAFHSIEFASEDNCINAKKAIEKFDHFAPAGQMVCVPK
jgi:hypothetical protein